MPRPVSATATYLPGLDGVRALAVIAVLGYHLEVPFLRGGLLGVGMFFTLSGFLITFILLREWDDHGRIDLKRFWLRRARRLLPAVILLLLVVLAATVLVAPDDLGDRLVESLAAMFYVSNWATIASDSSYFVAFAGPGPLDHLWSLAVEEQFYLVWPLLFVGLLTPLRRHIGRVALITLGLAAASFVWMYLVAEPGFDNTRAYEGTDTRAGGLLLGAVLAMVWRPDRLTAQIAGSARDVVDGIGLAALGVLVWQVVATDPFSLSLYRGGLLLLSLATALLLAVAVHPASRMGALLGTAPMVWIGERSYGIYLWHLPVIAFTPVTVLPDRPVVLGATQLALSVALAALSWTFVEDPIRRHGLVGAIEQARGAERDDGAPTIRVSVSDSDAGGRDRCGGRRRHRDPRHFAGHRWHRSILRVRRRAASHRPRAGGERRPRRRYRSGGCGPGHDGGCGTGGGARHRCDAVVHIGDSTSRGLFDEDQLPDPADRIDGPLRRRRRRGSRQRGVARPVHRGDLRGRAQLRRPRRGLHDPRVRRLLGVRARHAGLCKPGGGRCGGTRRSNRHLDGADRRSAGALDDRARSRTERSVERPGDPKVERRGHRSLRSLAEHARLRLA